jgi:tetratricopeptide (TPR) repeat protein
MRTDSWKLILAPRPELYNLARDPGEKQNLYADSPADADRLRKQIVKVAGTPGPQKIAAKAQDEKTLRELKSLGYLGAGRREIRLGTDAPDPKDRVEVLKILTKFEDLLKKRDYVRAAQVAEQAYRLDPTNPRGHLYLATAYEETSQYQRAIGVLQHAVSAGIQTDRIYSRLGIDYLHLQQMDKAVDALEHAARLNPSDLPTLLNLGMAYLQLNRAQEAEKVFRTIVAQDGNYAGAHNGLGIIAAQRGDPEGARREFQMALAADPKEVKSLLDLGILFQNMGDRKQALHYLHLFLDHAPRGEFTAQIPEVREAVREMENEERNTGAGK